MEKYSVFEEPNHIKIIDTDSTSALNITLVDTSKYIIDPCHISVHYAFSLKKSAFVTGRNIEDYDSDIRDLMINPELQYIEVGAGMGEFIPLVTMSNPKHLPIVIDPINYETIKGLLQYSLTFNLKDMQKRVKKLLDNCNIITNPKKVRLINTTLDYAILDEENLGIADIVVDNVGASHYGDYKKVWELERKLLNPSGKLISEVVKSGMPLTKAMN